MFFGEAFYYVIFVFVDSFYEVAGYADVEGAVFLAGQDVDVGVGHGG